MQKQHVLKIVTEAMIFKRYASPDHQRALVIIDRWCHELDADLHAATRLAPPHRFDTPTPSTADGMIHWAIGYIVACAVCFETDDTPSARIYAHNASVCMRELQAALIDGRISNARP